MRLEDVVRWQHVRLQPEEVDEVMLLTPGEVLARAEAVTADTPARDRVTPDSVAALRRYVEHRGAVERGGEAKY